MSPLSHITYESVTSRPCQLSLTSLSFPLPPYLPACPNPPVSLSPRINHNCVSSSAREKQTHCHPPLNFKASNFITIPSPLKLIPSPLCPHLIYPLHSHISSTLLHCDPSCLITSLIPCHLSYLVIPLTLSAHLSYHLSYLVSPLISSPLISSPLLSHRLSHVPSPL